MDVMRGSRNFHEKGSNENGNFWSQTRGGPTLKKSRNDLFLGKVFKFQGGPDPRSPPLDPRMNDVRGYFLGPPPGTTPVTVITDKIYKL